MTTGKVSWVLTATKASRDPVRERLAGRVRGMGEDVADRGVEGELDQHARRGRHRPVDRDQEALGPPVQQQPGHEEQEVVGVEVRDGDDGALPRRTPGPSQPSARATTRTVRSGECSSHSPGCCGGGRSSSRWLTSTPRSSRGHRRGAGRRGPDADHHRDHDQHRGHHHRLPEEDRLGERNHPGDRQQRGRQARRVGLELGGGRAQAQRPGGAETEIGRRPGGAVVDAQVGPPGDGADEQAAEDQAEAPAEQGGEHARRRRRGRRRRGWSSGPGRSGRSAAAPAARSRRRSRRW